MERQGLPHRHRSLRFRVQREGGEATKYEPAIVAHRGPILFLVEPVTASSGGRIDELTAFLEQHSPEIVLIAVTPDPMVRRLPGEAYDEIYPASQIRRLTERIRNQDPEGIVLPFEKPSPRAGKPPRDTAK
jgi:hypothetical protein